MTPPPSSPDEPPAGAPQPAHPQGADVDDPLSSGPPDYDAELVKILVIAGVVPAALLVLAGLGWLADWARLLTTTTP